MNKPHDSQTPCSWDDELMIILGHMVKKVFLFLSIVVLQCYVASCGFTLTLLDEWAEIVSIPQDMFQMLVTHINLVWQSFHSSCFMVSYIAAGDIREALMMNAT